MEKLDGVIVLASRGGQQREVDRECVCAFDRATAKAYFAEDHGFAPRLLCMVVGRRHAGDLQIGKKITAISFGIGNSLA